jgi:ATP-dependent helicase HrpB
LTPLPVDAVLPDLVATLKRSRVAVLQADPGAGKTTRVPLHLLDAGLFAGKILMLEPRRIAARAAARRLAESLGEDVGGQVGYRTRGDSRPGTRIEVLTEGVFTRMLQDDPELAGTGCVIFDEFHERALQSDLGLALVLDARSAFRPDLVVLVMSATLDAAAVSRVLGDAPVVSSRGRSWPVETLWLERPVPKGAAARTALERSVRDTVLRAAAETSGGLLVFLPGRPEIGRVAGLLRGHLSDPFVVQELHGSLGPHAQMQVLAPLPGRRRIVLSTSIAETSITIPDIRVVVDAGRARRSRFDPNSGMSRLVTEPVTRAEADQRRGRAGRVAGGWCYRCWTRGEEGALSAFPPPEILIADLAAFALELAVWGATDPGGLRLPTAPPDAAWAEAVVLLKQLGALDAAGRVTGHGKTLARMPAHPRLGHMIVEADARGAGRLATNLAALLENGDPLRRGAGPRPSIDMAARLALLGSGAPDGADEGLLAGVRRDARRLGRILDRTADAPDVSPGAVLSLAYPDRIAVRREGAAPRYLLSGGKGAMTDAAEPLGRAPLLVAADLDGDPREARIRLALPVAKADVLDLHAPMIRAVSVCGWSRRDQAVVARHRVMLGAAALEEKPWEDPPDAVVAAALIAGIRDLGLEVLPWTPSARRFASRVEWARAQGEPQLPAFSDAALAEELEAWLLPYIGGIRRLERLRDVKLFEALRARLSREQQQRVERAAPQAFETPAGRRAEIDYAGPAPAVSVRVQELFGLTTHPTAGRVPLVVHLLSPANRPVQSTSNIPEFWKTSYSDVRRDMRGRYPRHAWPEDPSVAEPAHGARRRRT